MNVVEPVATSTSPVPRAQSSAEESTPSTSPTSTSQYQHTYPLLILATLTLVACVTLVLTNHDVPGVILDAYPILVGALAGVTLPRVTKD